MPLRPVPTRIVLATLSTVAVAAAILTGCGAESGTGGAGDPGPVHVHGLGVDTADSSHYIATHTGLFRMGHGADDARRVGDSYQDTMGFTVLGASRFRGSGHPDLRTDLPPHLGLIEATDGGRTWEPISLLGEDGFAHSSDGGRSWAAGAWP
jgi:hypothetical protein